MHFFIKSYGCQMNLYDSRKIYDALTEAGHRIVLSMNDADLVILNTCSIREKVDEKIFSDLGRLKFIKEKSPSYFLIAVVGCMAGIRRQDIVKRAPYVDIVLDPQNIKQMLPEINGILKSKVSFVDSGNLQKQNKLSNRQVSEFLTIQEGCNNFCTYCIVPYTRGREFSKDIADIMREAKELASSGVKEITLLGQNVNAYNKKDASGKSWNLSSLLFELAGIDGLKRLKYMTSHPMNIDVSLARAHKEIKILSPFLHLPVQSGSTRILERMNRKYTRDEYLECISMLREYRPDIAFSSDFIVGFPGETEGDFDQTMQLIKSVRYAQAYSFKYSVRPSTPASEMTDQISESVKSERLQAIQSLLNYQQSKFNENFVGKHLNVLLTKNGKHKNQLVGRSEYSQAVSINGNDNVSLGDIAYVKITEAASHSLIGVVEK